MSSTDTQAVSLALRSYSGQVELHDHDYHQIVLPQSGSMDIEVDGLGGKVDWIQGVVISAGTRHAFTTKATNTFLVLDIPIGGREGKENTTGNHGLLNEKKFFPIRPEIRHLLCYVARSMPLLLSSPQLAAPWCTLLLSTLMQPHSSPDNGQFILARALTYIENNLSAPTTAQDIARASGTSERRLYVLFRQHLKSTPFAHIATLRLNLAIDLLCETQLPIAEIAHRAGYADQSALTHALKKARGLTPGAVRKEVRVG